MTQINSIIGNYRITRLIGEGGMATVYEGVHQVIGKRVAIKVLHPILLVNNQIRERFKNEATMMASLDHPNIVDIVDFIEEPTILAIVMELLDGQDFNEYIKLNGAFSEETTVRLFGEILDAFSFAHERGIVHRDVKPSNIFLLKNGKIKILDFGIAKLFGTGSDQTKTGTQIGTPIYMSPEQVKGDKSTDHRSDIYSLGVTLHFMLSGKPPYNDDTDSSFDIYVKIVNEPLPVLENFHALQEVIRMATTKDRNLRFQSCAEFQSALSKTKEIKSNFISEKIIAQDSVLKSEPVAEDIERTKKEDSHGVSIPPSLTAVKTEGTVIITFTIVILVLIFAFIYGSYSGSETDTTPLPHQNTVASPTVEQSEVQIGLDIWMTRNLDVTNFRNGDPIEEAKSADAWKRAERNKTPAWCYYDNDAGNNVKHGKLYNWFAVNDKRGLAPVGWHIPNGTEWRHLADELGGESLAGTKMMSATEWEFSAGTNESGFCALPSGERFYSNGDFQFMGLQGGWWSSTKDQSTGYENGHAIAHSIFCQNKNESKVGLNKTYLNCGNGLSVRLVKD